MKALLIPLLLLTFYLNRQTHDTAAKTMKNISYLALGDSYTIGESVGKDENFPAQLKKQLCVIHQINISEEKIIARTGWTTADLSEAVNDGNLNPGYDLVTLLIGVNNQFQGKDANEYAKEFEELLKSAIHLAKNKRNHVFVLSIPDYGFTKFGVNNKENISKQIDLFNAINKKITIANHVTYVDITGISRNTDLIMTAGDGLHPSAIQYDLWVKLLADAINKNAGFR